MGARMRYGAIAGLLAAGAVAALPAAAHAGARADYRQAFSTPALGSSTGTDTQILYKHPDDPNAKPIPVRHERFTFPKGTQFDDGVVPACGASDLEARVEGPDACPHETWMGGSQGDTSMSGFEGDGEMPLTVDGFNDGDGLLLIAGPTQYPMLRFVTRTVRTGRVIDVEVPRSPGGPPDGESAIRRVHHVFAPRSLGKRAYQRTPSTCPKSGYWTFTAQFTFADGAVENDVSRMRCHRHRPRRR
jgi:hypothetical protein